MEVNYIDLEVIDIDLEVTDIDLEVLKQDRYLDVDMLRVYK